MSETKDDDAKKPLSLNRPKLELEKTVGSGQVRQSFSHGRSKTVQVEVKRKRTIRPGDAAGGRRGGGASGGLTQAERDRRLQVLEQAKVDAVRKADEAAAAAKLREEKEKQAAAEAEARRLQEEAEAAKRAEQEAREAEEARQEAARKADEEASAKAAQAEADKQAKAEASAAAVEKDVPAPTARTPRAPAARPAATEDAASPARGKKKGAKGGQQNQQQPQQPRGGRGGDRRRQGKLTISQAMSNDNPDRQRSMAAVKRQREREKQASLEALAQGSKIVRDVVVPEAITVAELANRMAERGGAVVKTLMKMGVMATINQTIDADTAELVVEEFGHKVQRVSEEDIEIGLKGSEDSESDLQPRPPVVTIMGHVDHGKTSLLDALRKSDVADHEAGGITQHIGAYQITTESGAKVTFVDTPGHAAFTEMRARGANVTDIVILVVAADDGIMEQTVEAIAHAKAAEVPIIVAINKMDKPEADAERVKGDLLRHELIPEDMGGDVICVPVSAKTREGLGDLLETILLQAEILELTANANRPAEGIIVESKQEQGRGSVATVLVQRGTLRVGDIFVAGSESGRVRALLDEKGKRVKLAGPSQPVEVLGLTGTPEAGEDLVVVEDDARAREVAEFRSEKKKRAQVAASNRGTLEQMLSKIQEGEAQNVPVVIKSDVHGSTEAIIGALDKLGTNEVKAQVLHSGVGGINESDVVLARAAGAIIIAFNVRANAQARALARRDGVDIRYYSIIYNVIDDVKAVMSGKLAPETQETFLGYAEIRETFNVSKVGRVAGCMITEGQVKRGANVRLLRDNVVIHAGTLKTLRRFKDEVKEVQQGYECGMAFENYQDIQVGDQIECYEVTEIARTL
ncbi:translation initiation factor IF-2 [Rhodovibrionaceae bacterium A322]